MDRDNVNQVIAENLRDARVKRGWSQAFVARQSGLCVRSIFRAENAHGVSRRTLKRLCGLYQVPLSLLYGEREKDRRGKQPA